jgi:hypothetical protein
MYLVFYSVGFLGCLLFGDWLLLAYLVADLFTCLVAADWFTIVVSFLLA